MTSVVEPGSQKDRIYAAIIANGGFKTWVELKDKLDFHIDPHSGTHLLYSLQKEGLITLREKERPLGQESKVIDIQPTRKAIQMSMNPQPEYVVIGHAELTEILDREGVVSLEGQNVRGRPKTMKAGEVGHVYSAGRANGETTRRHPVGKDMTDPGSHRAVAQGGPITRSEAPQAVMETILPPQFRGSERAPEQNEKAPGRAPQPMKTIFEVIEWDKYPLIGQLQHRSEAVFRASKIMEEAGLADQAIAILETVVTTAFEKEVLSLIEEMK